MIHCLNYLLIDVFYLGLFWFGFGTPAAQFYITQLYIVKSDQADAANADGNVKI